MYYEPAWDAGEWADIWDETPHDANEFEATPPPACKHSGIRVPVLREWTAHNEVWAWKCRLCGAALYEVPPEDQR